VRAGREFGPDLVPLPHPSPRNLRWFRQHPWFASEVLPALRRQVQTLLSN